MTYPFVTVDGPDALLDYSEFSNTQLFVNCNVVSRNDMFVGRRSLGRVFR